MPAETDRTNEERTEEVTKAPPSVFKSVRRVRRAATEEQGSQNALLNHPCENISPFTKEGGSQGISITSPFLPQEPPTLTHAGGELREKLLLHSLHPGRDNPAANLVHSSRKVSGSPNSLMASSKLNFLGSFQSLVFE